MLLLDYSVLMATSWTSWNRIWCDEIMLLIGLMSWVRLMRHYDAWINVYRYFACWRFEGDIWQWRDARYFYKHAVVETDCVFLYVVVSLSVKIGQAGRTGLQTIWLWLHPGVFKKCGKYVRWRKTAWGNLHKRAKQCNGACEFHALGPRGNLAQALSFWQVSCAQQWDILG